MNTFKRDCYNKYGSPIQVEGLTFKEEKQRKQRKKDLKARHKRNLKPKNSIDVGAIANHERSWFTFLDNNGEIPGCPKPILEKWKASRR